MSNSANFRISRADYNSIKSFVCACWKKYPQFVKPEEEYPPVTIEIDEDCNAPIGSLCWFINRKSNSARMVVMNQSPKDFKEEFEEQFHVFKKYSTILGNV